MLLGVQIGHLAMDFPLPIEIKLVEPGVVKTPVSPRLQNMCLIVIPPTLCTCIHRMMITGGSLNAWSCLEDRPTWVERWPSTDHMVGSPEPEEEPEVGTPFFSPGRWRRWVVLDPQVSS